jgi:peptidyl-prolyl cis-trans isomerase SurA
MKKFCAIFMGGLLAGWAGPVQAEVVNGIRAIVADSVITVYDVALQNSDTAQLLSRQYRDQPVLFEQKMRQVDQENLEKFMEQQLILHEFKTAGYNLPESVIDDEVRDQIHQKYYGDRVTMTKTLQAEGITFEQYRSRLRDQVIVQAMRQKNISSELIISPHKVEAYYLAHRDDYKVEESVKLRMIVLNKSADTNAPQAEKLAQEILLKLKEGTPFAEMAKLYSQGNQQSRAGDWDWVEKSVLRKELADVVFTLKPGEYSGVIDTPESCYLVLVEDRRPAHAKSLGEVRDIIEKNLLLEEHNRLEKEWVARLKKKTFARTY